jgi:hypothetical protein
MAILTAIGPERDGPFSPIVAYKCLALRRGSTRRIGNGQKRENGTNNDCARPSTLDGSPPEWVTYILGVGMVSHGGHRKVCAINGHHTSLCQPGTWVSFLDRWMDAYERYKGAERQVEGDEKLV